MKFRRKTKYAISYLVVMTSIFFIEILVPGPSFILYHIYFWNLVKLFTSNTLLQSAQNMMRPIYIINRVRKMTKENRVRKIYGKFNI